MSTSSYPKVSVSAHTDKKQKWRVGQRLSMTIGTKRYMVYVFIVGVVTHPANLLIWMRPKGNEATKMEGPGRGQLRMFTNCNWQIVRILPPRYSFSGPQGWTDTYCHLWIHAASEANKDKDSLLSLNQQGLGDVLKTEYSEWIIHWTLNCCSNRTAVWLAGKQTPLVIQCGIFHYFHTISDKNTT